MGLGMKRKAIALFIGMVSLFAPGCAEEAGKEDVLEDCFTDNKLTVEEKNQEKLEIKDLKHGNYEIQEVHIWSAGAVKGETVAFHLYANKVDGEFVPHFVCTSGEQFGKDLTFTRELPIQFSLSGRPKISYECKTFEVKKGSKQDPFVFGTVECPKGKGRVEKTELFHFMADKNDPFGVFIFPKAESKLYKISDNAFELRVGEEKDSVEADLVYVARYELVPPKKTIKK